MKTWSDYTVTVKNATVSYTVHATSKEKAIATILDDPLKCDDLKVDHSVPSDLWMFERKQTTPKPSAIKPFRYYQKHRDNYHEKQPFYCGPPRSGDLIPDSIRTKSQKKTFKIQKGEELIEITIRYDDQCGNGHNDFSITGSYWDSKPYSERNMSGCGCIHDEIAKTKYAHLIKWHLVNSDGPMYYTENGIYHLGYGEYGDLNMDHFKSHVCYGVVPEMDNSAELYMCLKSVDYARAWMVRRLPLLMERFKAEIETLGFTY